MTGTSTRNRTTRGRKATTTVHPAGRRDAGTVDVVVVVNHDDLRRGERGRVELTETVRRRLDAGYLRLADDRDAEPYAPVVPELGATAAAGRDRPGALLGVERADTAPTTTGGGSDAASGAGDATA